MSETTGLQPDEHGFYHPANEAEIIQLIQRAVQDNLEVRVRGSAHSVDASIYTDGFKPDSGGGTGIDIMLDQMIAVTFDDARQRVTAQAGCHLGVDPFDPTHTSTQENSLFYQIDQKGWAVPDMGGITHQTVGGFISTGSSGGSVMYSFDDAIVGLRIIDGTGTAHDLSPDDPATSDLFYAAGVSMGLLGIITAVTFQCIGTFNIKGQEAITTYEGCEIDLFGPGTPEKPSLQDFLIRTPYTRLMWWPQQGAERMVVWQAARIEPTPDFQPKPYEEFPMILGSELPAEAAAGLFYTLVGRWPDWVYEFFGDDRKTELLVRMITEAYPTLILPRVIDVFVPINTAEHPAQQFQDYWWHGLPMDNQVSDVLMPTEFTEIWIPISQTEAVMNAMLDHYRQGGMAATGSYSCEVYAARSSKFWMSPSYGEDVVRVDIFWFGYNKGNPVDYYNQFWDLLKGFGFRLHWGKYLPDDQDGEWAKYFEKQYPEWGRFMEFRAQMDPHQIFVTDYWREHLGIPPVGA